MVSSLDCGTRGHNVCFSGPSHTTFTLAHAASATALTVRSIQSLSGLAAAWSSVIGEGN